MSPVVYDIYDNTRGSKVTHVHQLPDILTITYECILISCIVVGLSRDGGWGIVKERIKFSYFIFIIPQHTNCQYRKRCVIEMFYIVIHLLQRKGWNEWSKS